MSPHHHCLNCSLLLTKSTDTKKELDIVTQNVQGFSIQSTIKVDTALSAIYNLKYLKDLHCITDNDHPSLLRPDLNYKDHGNDEEFAVCDTCHPVLVNLVKFYIEFNRLRALDSGLSKKIKNLNDLIQRIPAIVNNSHDKITTTTTTTNSKNNNSKHSEEESRENGDDGDSNYLDEDDVSNFMERQLKDDDDVEVQLPQIEVDEDHNGQEESRKISFVRIPTVKVCRLRQQEIEAAVVINYNKNEQQEDVKQELESDEDAAANSPWEDEDDSDFELSEEELDESKCNKASRGPHVIQSRSIMTRGRQKAVQMEQDPLSLPKIVGQSQDDDNTKKPSKSRSKKKTTPIPDDDDDGADLKPIQDMRAPLKLLNGICPMCPVSFNVASNLVKHIMTHMMDPSGKKLSCPVPGCVRSYLLKKSLSDHLRRHAQTDQEACPQCNRKFLAGHKKKDHFRTHWKDGKYICEKCHVILESLEMLSNHRSTAHTKTPANSCPSCPDKLFSSERLLTAHLDEVHPGEKLFVCPTCLSSYGRKKHLIVHSKRHGKNILQCDLCKKNGFPSEKKLERHRELCQGPPVYVCSICSKKLKNKRHCLFHEQIHKGEAKILECSYDGCNKTFYNRWTLEQHVMGHTGERPFTCEYCADGFRNARGLKRHYLVHSGKKSFLCPNCGKKFMREAGLKKHLLTHSDVKGYTCKECGNQFKYSESLRLHFLNHHQENQFVCTTCDAGFPYNFMLQKHMSTAH